MTPLLDELLGPLHMHFAAARNAYADYLAGGKTYLFACSLRRINGAARDLLLAKARLLPDALQEDALALVRHYDVWTTLWDAHEAALRPAPGDLFAFENAVTYPRDAEAKLEALHAELRGAGSA